MSNITFNNSIKTYFKNQINNCSDSSDDEKMMSILSLAKTREQNNNSRFIFLEIFLPVLICSLVLFLMVFPVQTNLDRDICNYLTVENSKNIREAIVASLRLLK